MSDQTRLKWTLAGVLNAKLTSPLRVEIVSADTTAATGVANLTELADTMTAELRLVEQMPAEQRPTSRHEITTDSASSGGHASALRAK